MTSAQLFLSAWLTGACVYAVPVWSTWKLSLARRELGASTELDVIIETLERRGLLMLGLLLACLFFPLSLAHDVVQVKAKLAELESLRRARAQLEPPEPADIAKMVQCEKCGSFHPEGGWKL